MAFSAEKLMGAILSVSAAVTIWNGCAKMLKPIPENADASEVVLAVDERIEAYHDMVDDVGDIVESAGKLKEGEDGGAENGTEGEKMHASEGPPGPLPSLEEELKKLGFEIDPGKPPEPQEPSEDEPSSDGPDPDSSPEENGETAEGGKAEDKPSLYRDNQDGTLTIDVEQGEIRKGHTGEGTGAEQIRFGDAVDAYIAQGVVYEVDRNGEQRYQDTGKNSIPQGEMDGTWQSRTEDYRQSRVDEYLNPDSPEYNPANYERCMAQCRCDAYSEIHAAPFYSMSPEEQKALQEQDPQRAEDMKRTVWDTMSPEERSQMREDNPQRAEILEKDFFTRMEDENGDCFDALDYGYTTEELGYTDASLEDEPGAEPANGSFDDEDYDFDDDDIPNRSFTPEQALEELTLSKDEVEANAYLDYDQEKQALEALDEKELRTGVIEPERMYPGNDGFQADREPEQLKSGDYFSRYAEKGEPGSTGRFATRAEMKDGQLTSPSYEDRSMVGLKERMQETFYQVAPGARIEDGDLKEKPAGAMDPPRREMDATGAGPDRPEQAEAEETPPGDHAEQQAVPADGPAETGAGQEAAFDRLMDYMARNDYGPMDYPTYSQDPTWRMLQSEAYPDYELPEQAHEMTQDEAFERLQDYMNSHEYGPEDFDRYSQDPEWRALEQIAYPDYELPPYRDGQEETHEDAVDHSDEEPKDGEDQPEEDEDQPEDGEDKPEDGEDQPEDGEDQPEDGEDQPEDGEDQPEDGEDQPEDGEDQPEDGEDQPEDGEDQPEDGEDQPEDGEDQPEDGEDQPEDGEDQPEDGEDQPEDGEDQAEDGEEQPKDGKDQPEDGEDQPEDGDDQSEDGEDQPEDVEDLPEDGEDQAEDGEDQPEDVEDLPEDGEDQPEDGEDQPEDGEDQPEDGEDQPEDGEDQPEDGEDQPEDGEDRPEDVEDQLEDGEDQPEHGEDQPEDGEDQPNEGEDQPEDSEDQAASDFDDVQPDDEPAGEGDALAEDGDFGDIAPDETPGDDEKPDPDGENFADLQDDAGMNGELQDESAGLEGDFDGVEAEGEGEDAGSDEESDFSDMDEPEEEAGEEMDESANDSNAFSEMEADEADMPDNTGPEINTEPVDSGGDGGRVS